MENADKIIKAKTDIMDTLEETKCEVWNLLDSTFDKYHFSPVSIQRVKDAVNTAIDFAECLEVRGNSDGEV